MRAGHADRPPWEPFLRVVRGNPTPEEIAALVAVLLASESDEGPGLVREPRFAWADPARVLHSWNRGPGGSSHRLPLPGYLDLKLASVTSHSGGSTPRW